MHVLVTGSEGQLGRAIVQAFDDVDVKVTGWSRRNWDITHPSTAGQVIELRPDVVINAAAWTDVDAAESNPTSAFAVNALGPKYLAEGCDNCGAALVQISTNEVFAGEPDRFYFEYDQPQPGSVYARSKRAGELAAMQRLERLYVVRVAWLFGPGGNNFPVKIAAAADTHDALRVVSDEFGNPTYAPDVAVALRALVETRRYGTYHLVNEGIASRFEWAQEVLSLTGRDRVELAPIGMDEWPRAAKPPRHAVLVNQAAAALGLALRPWQEALAEYVQVDAGRFERLHNVE